MLLQATRRTAPRLARRVATAARVPGVVDEPLSTAELERKLVELHAPGQHRTNAKWALYGGHQRARNFAGFHGVFPALLPSFTPSVELVVRLESVDTAAPAADTHLLYGNRLPTSVAYSSAHAVSFTAPSVTSSKFDAATEVPSDAPWTLVGLSFSPTFAPAMVDARYIARHALPLPGAPPPGVESHLHLVVANAPSAGALGEGETFIESDIAGFDAGAMRARLLAPPSTLPAPAAEALDGVPDELRRLYVGYFCFQQRSGRLSRSELPAGRGWSLADWVAASGLVPRGLAFGEVVCGGAGGARPDDGGE